MKSIKEIKEFNKEGENLYFAGRMRAAYELFLYCEKLALELGDSEWIAETTKNVGRVLHRTGAYEEAKEKYISALELLEKINLISKKPMYLNHLANVYQFTNEFKKQYDCLQEALNTSIELDDQYTIAKINNSLGVYYEIFGEYHRALNYMQQALAYFSTHKNDSALIKTLNLISSVKTKLGYFDDALKDAQKVYSISKHNHDNYNLAHSLRNIISIYFEKGNLEECSKFFDELLKVKDKLENIKMGCDILRVIGLVYQELNEIKKASKAFSEALDSSKKINYYHGIAKSNELLGDLFYKIESYLESYRFYSNSLSVFQSIFNSIKDPSLKENYRKLFKRLPDIINKVDTILNKRSYDLPANEIGRFSKKAVNLCIQVQKQNFGESISKECFDNVKQLDRNKKN